MTARAPVLMICTAARGGMRTVVEGYEAAGLHARWHVQPVWTHAEASLPARLRLALLAYLRCFWQLLRGQVGLMHVHAAMRGSFWRKSVFVWLGVLFGVPVVLHLHGSETVKFIHGLPGWGQRLARAVLERASRVVVLSERWEAFVAEFAPRARVEVIGNCVEVPATCPAVMSRADGEALRIVFMGAVGQRKGIYPLLEAFAGLVVQPGGVPAELVVGGNGEVDKARAHAAQLGIQDRVHFLGWVDGAERDRQLARAHVFVLPSFNEGLPMSLLEAMAQAVPVVSTRVGGIPDLITHQRDGLLVDAGDVEGLGQALAHLGRDESARQQLARAGHARVLGTFSTSANLPKLERLYETLTASR